MEYVLITESGLCELYFSVSRIPCFSLFRWRVRTVRTRRYVIIATLCAKPDRHKYSHFEILASFKMQRAISTEIFLHNPERAECQILAKDQIGQGVEWKFSRYRSTSGFNVVFVLNELSSCRGTRCFAQFGHVTRGTDRVYVMVRKEYVRYGSNPPFHCFDDFHFKSSECNGLDSRIFTFGIFVCECNY